MTNEDLLSDDSSSDSNDDEDDDNDQTESKENNQSDPTFDPKKEYVTRWEKEAGKYELDSDDDDDYAPMDPFSHR